MGPLSYSADTKVDGRSRHRGAGRQYGFVNAVSVHTVSAERREQCGMDVDHPVAICLDDGLWNELQVAGQHDELYLMRLQQLDHLLPVGWILDHGGRHASSTGPLEGTGGRLVASDEYDTGRSATLTGIQQRLQVGTTP